MLYSNETCNKFVLDMADAGYEVEHYRGRNFWEGPAVRCERGEYQDIIRATDVRLQSDEMGRGMIVYPITPGRLETAAGA